MQSVGHSISTNIINIPHISIIRLWWYKLNWSYITIGPTICKQLVCVFRLEGLCFEVRGCCWGGLWYLRGLDPLCICLPVPQYEVYNVYPCGSWRKFWYSHNTPQPNLQKAQQSPSCWQQKKGRRWEHREGGKQRRKRLRRFGWDWNPLPHPKVTALVICCVIVQSYSMHKITSWYRHAY